MRMSIVWETSSNQGRKRPDTRRICGPASVLLRLSSASSAFGTTARMCGDFLCALAGAASDRPAARSNGMRKPLRAGSVSSGRALKKSLAGSQNRHLYRREWPLGTAVQSSNVGTPRSNADPPAPVLVEESLGDRGGDLVELLLPDSPRRDPKRASDRLLASIDAAHSHGPSDRLGWPARALEPRRRRVCRGSTRTHPSGTPAGLCTRTESRRVPVGLLEENGNGSLLPTR